MGRDWNRFLTVERLSSRITGLLEPAVCSAWEGCWRWDRGKIKPSENQNQSITEMGEGRINRSMLEMGQREKTQTMRGQDIS